MKICPKCEAANSNSAKFCSECGLALNAPAATNPPATPALETSPPESPLQAADVQASAPLTEETTALPVSPILAPPAPTVPTVPDSPIGSAPALAAALSPLEQDAPPAAGTVSSGRLNVGELSMAMSRIAAQVDAPRKADIMFVLDCTDSMKMELEAIKDGILSFADTITKEGVQMRVGLIAFRDRLHKTAKYPDGEDPIVLDFGGSPFTSDPVEFRNVVEPLRARGGGDLPESTLDAILIALRQPFAPDANKILVLVTDAPPHIPDKEAQSVEEVSRAIQECGVRQLYMVIRVQDAESTVYLKLLEGTVGLAFDLGYGDDFSARKETFVRTLQQLGKTISRTTR